MVVIVNHSMRCEWEYHIIWHGAWVGSAANSQNIAGKWHRRRATLSCRAYTMNSLFILPRPCLAFVQPREFYLLAGTALRHIANDCVFSRMCVSNTQVLSLYDWLHWRRPSQLLCTLYSAKIYPTYCIERPWRWRFKRNGIRSRTIKKVKYAYRNLQHVRVRARKPYNYLFIVCNL